MHFFFESTVGILFLNWRRIFRRMMVDLEYEADEDGGLFKIVRAMKCMCC